MVKINPNFGYWKNGTYHLKFSITNNTLNVVPNPYLNITFDSGFLYMYALQDITVAFSQNCFNQNFTPTILNIETNPTYLSSSDHSYSAIGDACDLTLYRCLEKGYGFVIGGLGTTTNYNIELLIK